MKIVGFYFSGTGNTKWVAESLEDKFKSKGHDINLYSIETLEIDEVMDKINKAEILGFLYPIYGCDIPKIFKDFLLKISSEEIVNPKKAFTITTTAMYAADGDIMVSKYFKNINVDFRWGFNILMPCNFDTFVPGFRIPKPQKVLKMKSNAEKKLDKIIDLVESNTKKIQGSDIFNRVSGGITRASEMGMMEKFEMKINKQICISCGKCVSICPTKNLKLLENNGAVETHGKCTVCLRCINSCPAYAIRLFNEKKNKPYNQYKGPERY